MRPNKDSDIIQIPMTFIYSGGRSDNTKTKVLIALISTGFLGVFLFFLFTGSQPIINKIIYGVGIFAVYILGIRYGVLNERKYRKIVEDFEERDYEVDSTAFWKIHDIDTTYPYICHYVNGLKGLFVRLEKDVIVGKSDYASYNHYEAIADAYNLAHSENINILHIDYMDNVGNDNRLSKLYAGLNEIENPDMQSMMLDIYQHLEGVMSMDYASYDIYVFYTKDDKDTFFYNVKDIVNIMLNGNYVSYRVLNSEEIRKTCVALFNLENFSIVKAKEKLMEERKHKGVVPIRLERIDGTIVSINKTTEELRVEREEKERLKAEASKRSKGREKKKKKKVGKGQGSTKGVESLKGKEDEIELDLFE